MAEEPASQTNNPQPATTSVPLPNATVVQSKPKKGSPKKKAIAMAAAFVMLLVVGGFVFTTMMPEESDSLMANILGSSDNDSSLTPEVPVQQTTIPTDNTSTSTPTNNIDNTQPQTPETTNTTTETPVNNIEQPTTPTVTITMDQAKNALGLIAHNSKRSLADALRAENQEISERLYSIFKESSALLETLANTSDISTIATIEQQIADLQGDLLDAINTLDAETSNNAQSQ